jgi:hypothetical protein
MAPGMRRFGNADIQRALKAEDLLAANASL